MKTLKKSPTTLDKRLSTETAISLVKTYFDNQLKNALQLHKVSAPMIVLNGTGINDDLSGVERPVSFPLKCMDEQLAEVVQSLAKWKRLRLAEYGIQPGEGILTDMRALRADEELSPIHSIFVDQWDWEKVIFPEQRHPDFLRECVRHIYAAILNTQRIIAAEYPGKSSFYPMKSLFFMPRNFCGAIPLYLLKSAKIKLPKNLELFLLWALGTN